MKFSDFQIGTEFVCTGSHWRCTDIGSRTVVAIRLDYVDVRGSQPRTLSRAAAEAEGWFRGPPYAVPETVFDEEDQAECSPA